MKKTKKGFSLIELLVAMIILSLIVSALAPVITRKLAASGITVGALGTGGPGEDGGNEEEPTYETRAPQSQADCDPYKAKYFKGTCITKANAGDTTYGGPSLDFTAEDGTKIEVKPVGTKCTTSICCHEGTTVASGSTFVTSSYSGKTRTVCTWDAAKIACDNYDINNTKGQWKLPTNEELQQWKSSTENDDLASSVSSLTKFLGKNGLDLCDGNTNTPELNHGSAKCAPLSQKCPNVKGTTTSCHPEYVWGAQDTDTNAYYGELISGKIKINSAGKTARTASVRCVLHEVSAVQQRPHEEDHTVYETPASQADCDPYNAKYFNNTCITKGNAGDTANFGPPIAKSGTPSAGSFTDYGIEVLAPGSRCRTNTCCWMGRTAKDCNTFKISNNPYDGCTRTVCTWFAADVACKNYNINNTKGLWELPTQYDLLAWQTQYVNDTSSAISLLSKYLGSDGIDLCSESANAAKSHGASRCRNNTDSSTGESLGYGCISTLDSDARCHPETVWGEGTTSNSNCKEAYFSQIESSTLSTPTAVTKGQNGSARCVLKKIKKRAVVTNPEDTRTFRAPSSQADCTPYNAIYFDGMCIAKGNVGDSNKGGAPITKEIGDTIIHGTITDLKILPLATGAHCSTNTCCWYGKTAGTCTTYSIAGSYDGCNRTVCTWYAADIACKNYNIGGNTKGLWRLPTKEELEKLKIKITSETADSATNINNFRGLNGLDLCEGEGSTSGAAGRGRALCTVGPKGPTAAYNGDNAHSDRPMGLWGEATDMTYTTKTAYTFGIGMDTAAKITIAGTRQKAQGALSARCVLDKIPKN